MNLIDRYGQPVALFAVALAIGLAVDTVVFWIIRGKALKNRWATGEALAHALHGFPTALSVAIGARLAVRVLDLGPTVADIALTTIDTAMIVIATAFSARVAGRLIRAYTEREGARLPSSTIFVNLARGLVWVLGGLVLLSHYGVSITPLLTALGVGGLAIGLALQSTLENLFSGIQILVSRQIQPGDFIEIESGERGWVEDVSWRNTTIKLFSNDLVIVPNSIIGQSRVTNFTTDDAMHVIWVDLGVAYDSDLELVERVTCEVVAQVQAEVPGAVPGYEPLFRYTRFGESAIGLTISILADTAADHFPVRHAFIKRLHAAYAEAGITIPFPQRTVHIAQPSEPAEEA